MADFPRVSAPVEFEVAQLVFGTADFTWNDRAYDARTRWPREMAYLAGGDKAATEAMLVFGDLEHLAPTIGTTPWQPQAPELVARVAEFWRAWDGWRRAEALTAMRANAIATAPATIRGGSVDKGFTDDTPCVKLTLQRTR
ncbi:hypothetical protein [Streptosporangium sp. NPDC087985]|uniref:hypothetical protein n=1 Tax=Streptosporangium sp. NPDC087985 TaxID=3366196 RepID=UPI0038250459